MISKKELIQMLWGIASHDNYWLDRNTEILSGGDEVVKKSEQSHARAIGNTFVYIISELRKLNISTDCDIPSFVLGECLPENLREIESAIQLCREQANLLSNP